MVGHVRRRAAGVILLLGSAGVMTALPVVWTHSGREVVETFLLVAVWVALGVGLLRGPRFEAQTAVALVVVAMAPLVLIRAPGPAGVPEPTAVAPAVVAAVVAILLLDRPWSCMLAGVVFVATVAVEVVTEGSRAAIDHTWPILVFTVSVAGAKAGLRRAAARADADLERQRAVDLELIRARAQESAHNKWQSLLHDEVAAALRAGATASVGRLEVRRSARAALQAIEEIAEPEGREATDLMLHLRRVGDEARTLIAVDGPDEAMVPTTVAMALVGAVTESVRNIERHAAGAGGMIHVERVDDLVTVTVTDAGPGFVVPFRRRPGGMQVSVLDRMSQAGGAAQVASAPGRGTTIRLWWPARPGESGREPIEDLALILGRAVLPVLAVSGLLAVPSWMAGHHLLGPTWWFAQVVLAIWLTYRPRAWVTVVATVVSVVGAAVVVTFGAQGPWNRTWPLLAVVPVMLHLVITGRALWGWSATAVMLAATVPLAGASRHTVAVAMTVIGMLTIGWVMAGVVRTMGAEAAAAAQTERDKIEETWRRSILQEVHARRRARLEDLVVPFLRRIADNETPLDAPVRAEAGLLEQAVRDEMHLPEVLDPPTRDLVGASRSQGCRVRLQADSATGIPAPVVCEVISTVLGHGDLPQEFTLSVYVKTERASIAVVAVPGDENRRAAIAEVAGDRLLTLEDTEDATWAELRI